MALRDLGDYLMPVHALRPSDLTVVFGSSHHTAELAESAAVLWKKRFTKYFVVTGGVLTPSGLSEAAEISSAMMRFGVSGDRILIESASTNTLENAFFAADTARACKLCSERITAVCKIFATRRVLLSLSAAFPNSQAICFPVNYFSVTRDRWTHDIEFRRRVFTEAEKIRRYTRKGDIPASASEPTRPRRDFTARMVV